MIYLLIALQLADLATTHYVLRKGIGTEANPLLKRLFDKFGHERVLLITKAAFIVWLLLLQGFIPDAVLWLLVAFYVWVVVNNLRVIRK
jgi:hypothetical protein